MSFPSSVDAGPPHPACAGDDPPRPAPAPAPPAPPAPPARLHARHETDVTSRSLVPAMQSRGKEDRGRG
ncbi:hypothetical protein F6J84_05565 [Microbacterium caowuchunii]|nr:hypothetical protein F6J84_05565 [Microbacterium caowuchunii]